MKKLLLLCTLICSIQWTKAQTTKDFKKLDWLEGKWSRTNSRPGNSGLEQWTKLSSTTWRGLGITMKGTDTAIVEKLQLMLKDDHIYYVADVTGNLPTGQAGPESVYFKFTSLTDNSFECENPEHDFPKKIAYKKEGNNIKATISGNGKSVDYLFEKSK